MDLIKGLTANYYINVAFENVADASFEKKACNGTNDRCRGNA